MWNIKSFLLLIINYKVFSMNSRISKRIKALIFFSVFALLTVYSVCCLPTYISLKFDDYSDKYHHIWAGIRSYTKEHEFLKDIYFSLLLSIPEWTMLFAVLGAIADMVFGFINYKKKWWYYLILVLTISMCVFLLDCHNVLAEFNDYV